MSEFVRKPKILTIKPWGDLCLCGHALLVHASWGCFALACNDRNRGATVREQTRCPKFQASEQQPANPGPQWPQVPLGA